MKPTSKQVVQGAIFLTIAGFISKVLSAIYRIPLQNLAGDIGFYVYQQVYPFIGTVMILSLYGFPLAVSSLVAETKQTGQKITWRQFIIPLYLVLLSINGIIFLFIFLSAPLIAMLSGEPTFTYMYRTVSILFLFVPTVALLRGTFQGIGEMAQTAYSQIIEQIVRVSIIIGAAYLVFIGQLHVNKIGLAGIIASIAGFVFISLLLLYIFMKRKIVEREKALNTPIQWKYFFSICLTVGLIASLNQLILIFIQFVDVITLVPNLIEFGLNMDEAREWKGIIDRGQPLIQFGVVIGSSFALALVPAMKSNQHKQTSLQSAQDALSLSFYLASGATVGLICILPEANLLLFMDDQGTFSLQILGWSILLSSVAITGSTILLSERQFQQIIFGIFVMIIIKYVLNEILIPLYSISGSAIATVISLSVFLIMIMIRLKSVHFIRTINFKAFLIAALGMVIYLFAFRMMIYPIFEFSRIGLLCYVLFTVISGALIYVILLIRNNAFSTSQLQNLPLSSFLQKFQRK